MGGAERYPSSIADGYRSAPPILQYPVTQIAYPPSATSSAPVMLAAVWDRRKAICPAISPGLEYRPRGVLIAAMASNAACSLPVLARCSWNHGTVRQIGVSVPPGKIELTLI